jgi:hypothetical protein
VECYDELVRQVLEEYEVIAADTYQRLRMTHPQLVEGGQASFVAAYTNRIAAQIPSCERIRTSFFFRFYRVPGPQQLGVMDASTPLGPSSVERTERRASAQQREQQRARMEQDMRQDAHQRANAMLDEWLTTIVAHLRALVYDAATDVLATMQRKGGDQFSGRSTMQLNNLLAQIRSLNFFGDTEIDQMMARIEQIVSLSPSARQRSLGDIQQTLRAIATTARATLLDLGDDSRAPRPELGIAAVPTHQLVSSARAELRLPPLDVPRLAALGSAETRRATRAELSGLDADGGPLWQFVEQAQTGRGSRSL